MMNTPAIEADALRKAFGEVKALDGMSFQVPYGTVLGLLGPNGSGKTTALSILATALRPDGGRATVCGLEVVRDAAAVREVIGFAGQFAAVDANLTGRENLTLIGRLSRLPRGQVKGRVGQLLEQFDLTGAADRLASRRPDRAEGTGGGLHAGAHRDASAGALRLRIPGDQRGGADPGRSGGRA